MDRAIFLALLPFTLYGVAIFLLWLSDLWDERSWQSMAIYHRWDRKWAWYWTRADVPPGELPERWWQFAFGQIEYVARFPYQRLAGPPGPDGRQHLLLFGKDRYV